MVFLALLRASASSGSAFCLLICGGFLGLALQPSFFLPLFTSYSSNSYQNVAYSTNKSHFMVSTLFGG